MSKAVRKISRGQLLSVIVAATVLIVLSIAVQAAREAARRSASLDNMMHICVALENYADSKGSFPAYANFSADGQPLLSWRVHILPYLGQQALYEQFRLDEPWDSEHNKTLIAKMPVVYLDPSSNLPLAEGRAHYLGVKGKEYVFNGTKKGTTYQEIVDGTSNTIMLVQVNDDCAAVWAKPEDWEVNPENPLAGLKPNLHPDVFLVGFVYPHTKAVASGIDIGVFMRLLTTDSQGDDALFFEDPK